MCCSRRSNVGQIAQNLWLSHWANQRSDAQLPQAHAATRHYLVIYLFLALAGVIAQVLSLMHNASQHTVCSLDAWAKLHAIALCA